MTPTQVRAAMLEDLARSGLTEEDAKTLQLSTKDHGLKPAFAGYTIPYFNSAGKKTKFYRVRYVENTATGFSALSGKKPLRYAQPPASVNEVYMAPYCNWQEVFKSAQPLIITEGEKKAAIATRIVGPTMGLGGVWCFMSKRAEAALLPVFDEISLKDRLIYICFDSDAVTNPDIIMAEATLAKRLIERGASVMIARIPRKGKGKIGIDDYLLRYTDPVKANRAFHRNILASAFKYEMSKELHAFNQEIVYNKALDAIYSYDLVRYISPNIFTAAAYSNRWIEVPAFDKEGGMKLVRKSAAKLWLAWEHRAEVASSTYAPGKERITEGGELNMWNGWGVECASKGDVSLWTALLDHLFTGSKPASKQWFERWCAYPIQHPGVKMASAAVIWGVGQGTGKTLCGHTLMRMYGENAAEVKDADLQSPRFEWAENKQFVLADDITGHDNRKMSNMFKTMVTQKSLRIDPKYIRSYTIPDCINYYFTSNDPDAFYLDDGDRRFFIHEVTAGHLPIALRDKLLAWIGGKEGQSALFYHLLNLDLGDFDPQAPALVTESKKEMTHIGKSELGTWVARLKDTPDAVLGAKLRGDLATAEELHAIYDPLGDKRASPNALARELKRAGFRKAANSKAPIPTHDGRSYRLYAVRNREQWLKASVKDAGVHYAECRALAAKKKF